VNADDVTIEGNEISDVGRSVFDIEPASPRWSVRGVAIRDNRVGGYRNFLLAAGGAGQAVDDLTLENNRVESGNGLAVFAGSEKFRRQGLRIVGNESTVPGVVVLETRRLPGVMQVMNYDGVEIQDNRQTVSPDRAAIAVLDVCDLDVSGNEFSGARIETQVVVECGAGDASTTSSTEPRGPGSTRVRAAPEASGTSGTRGPAASAPLTTTEPSDGDGWITAGLVSAVVVLALLAGLAGARWRRRSSTERPSRP
jgi:hypothetical protein